MFGYVTPNLSALDETQKRRFREVYCGLCKTLRERHGWMGSSTLSYDLTFLALLLQSLYEAPERRVEERCPPHPWKRHGCVQSAPFEYAADMNVALAYHKCMDNWLDDRNLLSRSEAQMLHRAYEKIAAQWPAQCRAIEVWLEEIHEIERADRKEIDAPVNSTGRMLGRLFRYREDFWSDTLERIGDGLGQFIYFMDAYEDLPKDVRKKSFNPLKAYCEEEGFETMCRDAMTMMVADCTEAFEALPLVQDTDLLRNVLYSGIWSRYTQIVKKKQSHDKGAE